MFSSIDEALKDLKSGKVIIVCDDENRENEGDFVALADCITPETVNFMITHGRGLLCMPIAQEIADRLDLHPMVTHNTDRFRTAFTVSVDHITNTTGISAFDRYTTIKELATTTAKPSDFRRPGHIFPLTANNNGVLGRIGHTEAVVDLARLCGTVPAGILCEIMNTDGTMARRDELFLLSQKFDLKMISVKQLIQFRKRHDKLVVREATTRLPTKFGEFQILGYRYIIDNEEAIVLVKQSANGTAPLVRIHSECLTGDIFGSLRCDCGPQLSESLSRVDEEGGVIIYLKQEGRGIGIINKLKAYALQDQGFDTVEANHELGFATDLREYTIAYQILKDLGISQIRLLSNNPQKLSALEELGIEIIELVKLVTPIQAENKNYISTKITKLGHLF